ncbi:Hypothetical_protein [Hexamita inflata]|uniref:Hypothetical_protein n=1 Tax=Hexamita inflata TaxID=28002 RepID=A0AA86R4A2_9EUKA|nr:Hypothetical protein HINF_LOCUS53513 [Hexamita inflata]
MVESDLQNNATKINRKEQIMVYEQNPSEQLTQTFQLILKEAGFTINGDDQLGIWKAVKSLSAQQRNQLKLWDRVVQICKLRDNKVAQQFFKQQCRKLQALQNETNDHSLFQDDRSQQELDKQNSEDIDVAQDLAQLNQDYVCYQDKPNEIESNQCQEEIQSIARESQVQLPDTQIILAQPESTENLIQAELQEQEVKAQESQPVLENELEPEIYIQTGILEQQARDLKYQIQVVSAQFQDEQHKLKLAHEIVKQLTAQSNNIISQSTPKEIIENIGVQMKNNDFLPLIFEQPEQQHSDRKELLEQEIQHLQKQLELASKKIRNEQYKLKLVNEVITNLICQNQQKTSEQNTLETHVLRTQQESYQKGIQESCSQSQQILANDSHLSIQNQKPNIEISYNQLEFVQLDQQDSCMHNNNQAHTISSQSDQLTSNNVQQSGFSLIQLDHQDDILNKSGQQVSAKQQGKQYSSQQLLLRLAVKQTLKEAGYEVETLSEKEICKTVHKLTAKEKRQLRFWDRVAQLCCRSKQQIVHFYRQTYKSSVYKNKPNQRVRVDNQEQLVCQQSDIQNNQKVNTTQKDGQVIIRKKRVRASQIGPQLMSFALRQVLAEIGYQVETASDKEICLHIDQMTKSQKLLNNFWNRVSILCQQVKIKVQGYYYRTYKQNVLCDEIGVNELQQNQDSYQSKNILINTLLKDNNVSIFDIQKYVSQFNQKQTITNIQSQNEEIEISEKLISAFKQLLSEKGLVTKNASKNKILNAVQKMTQEEKKQLNFWNRAAEICQVDLEKLQIFYIEHYTSRSSKRVQITEMQQKNNLQAEQQIIQDLQQIILIFTLAFKQILKEEGQQMLKPSINEICIQVDQISESQMIKLKFWDRVSELCHQSPFKVESFYYLVQKKCIFTNTYGIQSNLDAQTSQLDSNKVNQLKDISTVEAEVSIQTHSINPLTAQQNTILQNEPQTDLKALLIQRLQEVEQNQAQSDQNSAAMKYMQNTAETQLISYQPNNYSQIHSIIEEAHPQEQQKPVQYTCNQIYNPTHNIQPSVDQLMMNNPINYSNQFACGKYTNSECKLRQQIPLALKKVFGDSGYNVKNATEKELCALVLFMNFRQKTEIDLWNRAAQLCDVEKAELQKFFYYQYRNILYSGNGAQNKSFAQ